MASARSELPGGETVHPNPSGLVGTMVEESNFYTQFQNEENNTQNNFRFSNGIAFGFGER
jgi:hypothetical protein